MYRYVPLSLISSSSIDLLRLSVGKNLDLTDIPFISSTDYNITSTFSGLSVDWICTTSYFSGGRPSIRWRYSVRRSILCFKKETFLIFGNKKKNYIKLKLRFYPFHSPNLAECPSHPLLFRVLDKFDRNTLRQQTIENKGILVNPVFIHPPMEQWMDRSSYDRSQIRHPNSQLTLFGILQTYPWKFFTHSLVLY